jgi:hypothetical protein
MFSQKEVKSPLAEKRVIYSLMKRGIFGRRCYSESTYLKKKPFSQGDDSPTPITTLKLVDRKSEVYAEAY